MAEQKQYKIEQGDTLSEIAKSQGTSVSAIVEQNPNIQDPDKIMAGETLNLPETDKQGTSESRQGTEITNEDGEINGDAATEDTTTTPDMPSGDTTEGDASSDSLSATAESIVQSIQMQREQEQKEREEFLKQVQNVTGQEAGSMYEALTQLGESRPTGDIQSILETEREEEGIPDIKEKINEQSLKVANLQNKSNVLNEQMRQEIANERDRMASSGAIASSTEEIEERYSRKKATAALQLGAETAVLQAYQGELTRARQTVNDTVKAATQDLEREINRFDTLFSVYGSWVQDLGQDERNILEATRENLRQQKQEKQQDLTNKLNMITQAANNGIDLGISSTQLDDMSIEEVVDVYTTQVPQELQTASAVPNVVELESEDGATENVNLLTEEGINKLKDAGYGYAKINNLLDKNADIDASSRKEWLAENDLYSKEENKATVSKTTIREAAKQSLVNGYNYDEIIKDLRGNKAQTIRDEKNIQETIEALKDDELNNLIPKMKEDPERYTFENNKIIDETPEGAFNWREVVYEFNE